MTCADSIELIGGATEGHVPLDMLDVLVEHLEDCRTCRFEAVSQMVIKRVLASRPEAPLPVGLEGLIERRLDRERPFGLRSLADWRKLALRLAPGAAALAMLAVISDRVESHRPVADLPAAVVSFGLQEVSAVPDLLASETSDAAAFGLLLVANATER